MNLPNEELIDLVQVALSTGKTEKQIIPMVYKWLIVKKANPGFDAGQLYDKAINLTKKCVIIVVGSTSDVGHTNNG